MWERLIEKARALGPIRERRYRVMVIEGDLQTSNRDFEDLKSAKVYADDAASETDDAPPVAVVLDDRFNVVHEGRPYYA